jgi:transposase
MQSMLLAGAPARRILDLADAHPGSVIVVSTHGRGPLARATLQQQVVTTHAQWEQVLWHLGNQRFACEPDAQAALAKQLKKRPTWLEVSAHLVAHPKHSRAGRPRPGATPDRTEWQIAATVAVNAAAIAREERRTAAFLVATNVLDPTQLSDHELIQTYQDQHSVEMDCTQMTSFVGRGTLISH